jgi:integrase
VGKPIETRPLAGAVVEALHEGNAVAANTTDEAGRHELRVQPGTYLIRVKYNRRSFPGETAEAQDLVRRNVSALVDTPRGREGRRSQSLTLEQATVLLAAAQRSRLHAYIALCLLAGIRSEEARALTWEHVDLEAGTVSVWRSVHAHGDKDRAVASHAEAARGGGQGALCARSARHGNGTMPGRCGRTMAWSWLLRWARLWNRTTSGVTSAR